MKFHGHKFWDSWVVTRRHIDIGKLRGALLQLSISIAPKINIQWKESVLYFLTIFPPRPHSFVSPLQYVEIKILSCFDMERIKMAFRVLRSCSADQNINGEAHLLVPLWYCTVLAVLVGNDRLSHSIFTLFIYFRLHRRYYTTVELELSNSRTLEPSTLEPSNCRLSNSCIRWLAILFDSSLSLANRSFEVLAHSLTLIFFYLSNCRA
jgi:hypothetical protein